MKIQSKHDIITDLCSDEEIYERFNTEMPKVEYWVKKHDRACDIQEAYFPPEPLNVVNKDTLFFEKYTAEGVVYWTNPLNGDTWAAAIFHRVGTPHRVMWLPFYYWLTIGSIGFMIKMDIGTAENMRMAIVAFSSHAMLRYRSRLKLDVSGFSLITHLLGRTYMNVPRVYEKNGRETFEMICADGVFRAPVTNRYVFQMKTFISWDELNRKDYKEAKELWDNYQEVFTEKNVNIPVRTWRTL